MGDVVQDEFVSSYELLGTTPSEAFRLNMMQHLPRVSLDMPHLPTPIAADITLPLCNVFLGEHLCGKLA